MPYASKSQMRLFFAKEKRGELPEGTAKQWARETPNIKKLPDRKKKKTKKKHHKKHASAFVNGFVKMAGLAMTPALKTSPALQGLAKPAGFAKAVKTASGNLAMNAADEANINANMDTFVPGSSIRGDAETGQFKGKSYRTQGVLNENKEFGKQFKRKTQTSRGGTHSGGTIRDGFSQDS